MRKWEYKTVYQFLGHANEPDSYTDKLNEHGEDGWIFCGEITRHRDQIEVMWVFRREIFPVLKSV